MCLECVVTWFIILHLCRDEQQRSTKEFFAVLFIFFFAPEQKKSYECWERYKVSVYKEIMKNSTAQQNKFFFVPSHALLLDRKVWVRDIPVPLSHLLNLQLSVFVGKFSGRDVQAVMKKKKKKFFRNFFSIFIIYWINLI